MKKEKGIKEDLKRKMQALLAEENKHVQDEKEFLTMDTSVRAFQFPFKKVTDILADTLKVRTITSSITVPIILKMSSSIYPIGTSMLIGESNAHSSLKMLIS